MKTYVLGITLIPLSNFPKNRSLATFVNPHMLRLRTAACLALTTGLLAGVMAWIALQMQLLPSSELIQREHQTTATNSLAATLSLFAERGVSLDQHDYASGFDELKNTLKKYVSSDPCIDYIVLKNRAGTEVLSTSLAAQTHATKLKNGRLRGQMRAVNIYAGDQIWGQVEITYSPTHVTGQDNLLSSNLTALAFLMASVALIAWALFSYAFNRHNTSSVVPRRVQTALDTLTEGVVFLNPSGAIAHSNSAFKRIVQNAQPANLHNSAILRLEDYGWQLLHGDSEVYPWDACFESRQPVLDKMVKLSGPEGTYRLSVNSSPIITSNGFFRGALISFCNVTEVERQRAALAETVMTVEEQNVQLTFLASYDPLTKSYNRREFFRIYEETWKTASPEHLSLLMIDIDHFKLINDTHGHSIGDQVLVQVAERIRNTVGDMGTVCRYGGEEFIVLLSDLELERALDVAEEVRRVIEVGPIGEVYATVSIGFSNRSFKAMDEQHLLDQADQGLYAAKRTGRNSVIRFDQCPSESEIRERSSDFSPVEVGLEVDYRAVIGLLSALSFHCPKAADHSLRVARLAVSFGQHFDLKPIELYRLEIAALLHDVGKISVLSSILEKAEPLTDLELVAVDQQYEAGLQITGNAIASEEILKIFQSRHDNYDRSLERPNQTLFGEDIPIASRILYVCDVFDTLIHDRPYRRALTVDEALNELKERGSGQFDPAVVKKMVQHVAGGGYDEAQNKTTLKLDSRDAVGLGCYIEQISTALESMNLENLQRTSRSLRTVATKAFSSELVDATIDLEDAISKALPEEQIFRIASEIIALCRDAQLAVLNRPASIDPPTLLNIVTLPTTGIEQPACVGNASTSDA